MVGLPLVLPGTKPAVATTPETVDVVAGGGLLAVEGELSLLPPQAARTQAAAIDVRRGVVRFIELTDIVGCPCRLHVLLLFLAFRLCRRQGIIESMYLPSVKGNFHYIYFQGIFFDNANRHFFITLQCGYGRKTTVGSG